MGLRSLASDTITNVTDCLLSPGVNEYDVGETKKKGMITGTKHTKRPLVGKNHLYAGTETEKPTTTTTSGM